MSDLNKVTIQGRIVRDAEFSTTDTGLMVGRFSIATNRYKKNLDGTPGEEVFFFPLVVFGKYAENLKQFLVKGQQLIVEGYLRQNYWEKDGEKKHEISISVENVHLVFGNKKTTAEKDSSVEMVTNFQRKDMISDNANEYSLDDSKIPF